MYRDRKKTRKINVHHIKNNSTHKYLHKRLPHSLREDQNLLDGQKVSRSTGPLSTSGGDGFVMKLSSSSKYKEM